MSAPDAGAIRSLMGSGESGGAITVLDVVDSTNRWMADQARTGEAGHGDFVVADRQTGGRGRRERAWVSPPGLNAYASFLVDAPSGPVGMIVYAAGLAVADTLETVAGVRAFLKWPNDVFAGEHKLCGILCESVTTPGGPRVVVGVGLNVNAGRADFPPDLRAKATSVAIETGREFDRNEVVARLYRAMMSRYNQLASDAARIVADWKHRAGLPGVRYRIGLDDGTFALGRAIDLAADGALIVETESGSRAIFTGDVVSWRVE